MKLIVLWGFLGCDPIKERGVTNPPPATQKSQSLENVDVVKRKELGTPHDDLLNSLYDSKTAEQGIKQLLQKGDSSLPSLETLLTETDDLIAKGWAIQTIAKMKSPKSKNLLVRIEKETSHEVLVRTWAAAALIQLCTTTDDLLTLLPLVQKYPSLHRPIGLRLEHLSGGLNSLQALELTMEIPQLKSSLQKNILSGEPTILIEAMLTHADMKIRRESAAYLATMGRSNTATIPALLKAYDFTPQATQVRWTGGPLYVPSIAWDKENGTALFAHLVSWYLFCEKNGLSQEQQQLYNNMRSVTLLGAIGMPRYIRKDTRDILKAFHGVVGTRQIQVMLEEQGMKQKYANILGGK